MARTSKLMRPFLDEADGSLHELAARTLHQARCHHDVSSCDVLFQGDRAPHSSKAHHPVMFMKGLCFCLLLSCALFHWQGQSHDYPNGLERSHGTFEGLFVFDDAKL